MADKYAELKYTGLSAANFAKLIDPVSGIGTLPTNGEASAFSLEDGGTPGNLNVYAGGTNPAAFMARMKIKINQTLVSLTPAAVDRAVGAAEAKNTWKKIRTAADRNTDLRAVSGRALAR